MSNDTKYRIMQFLCGGRPNYYALPLGGGIK